ncbi:MAG TPA: hypothetical protein VM532_04135, partial [Burkholderiales bacterium]|nr:hypothetical protein [Burkholderiales bacterium]
MDAPENDKTDLTLDDYREQFFSLQNAEERTRWVLAVTSYFEKNPPPSGELAWSAVLGLSAELEVEKEDRALLESLQSHIQNSIANNSDPERALAEGVKVFSEVATRIQSKSVGSRPEFLKKAHQVISTELEKRVHDGSVLEHLALVSHTLSTQLPYLEWLHIKRLEIEALRNHFTHSSSLFLPDRLRTWNHVGRLRSLDSKLFHDTCQAMGAELQKCKPDEFSGSDLRHLVVLIDTFRSAGLGRLATTLAEKVVEIVAAVDANKLKLLFAPGDGDKKNFQETALLIAGAFTEPQLPGDWPGMALLAKSFVPFAQFGDCRRLIFRPIAEKKLQSPELGPLAADDIPHVFSLVDSFHRMSQAFPLGSSFRRFSDELRDDALTRVFNRIGDIRDPEALIEADKHCRYSAAGQWAILHCAKAAERIVKTSQETNSENLERESQQLETVGRWIDRLPDRNEYSQARRLV